MATLPLFLAERRLGGEGRANTPTEERSIPNDGGGAHSETSTRRPAPHPPRCARRPLRKGEGWRRRTPSLLKPPPAVDRQAVPFETHELLRRVGQHDHAPNAQLAQNLRADADHA